MSGKFDDDDLEDERVAPNRSPARRPRPARDHDMDEDDEEPVRRRPRETPDATGGLIPYKNPTALIGYYCGVFSLIPFLGFILAPAALVLGILGIRYANRHPTAKGTGHAIVALVLGALSGLGHLGCIVFGVVSILVNKK